MKAENCPFRADCIIFDLDGTLADTIDDIVATAQHIMAQAGFEPKSREAIRALIGGGARKLLVRCFDGSEELADRWLAPFAEHYSTHAVCHTRLYPHAKEILEHYHGRIPLALATAKAEAPTMAILDHFGILPYFSAVVTSDHVTRPKPDGECIQLILDRLHLDPGQVWMVGDTTTDLLTAQNGGVRACAVSYGYGKREDMEALHPDLWIDSLAELKANVE